MYKLILMAVVTLALIFGLAQAVFANTPGKHTVGLTWNYTCPTGQVCTFNMYRGTATGVCNGAPTPYATGIPSTSFTDLTVTPGTTYFYAVSAVNGGESACSAEAQAAVPLVPPAPTNLQGVAQ